MIKEQSHSGSTILCYDYKAVDRAGKSVRGKINASDISEAKVKIKDMSLVPIKVTPNKNLLAALNISKKRKVSLTTVAMFCNQLYSITSSGVNILRGIEILGKQSKSKMMKDIVSNIMSEVQKGKSLSEAMANDDCPLPKLLVSMVAVGEVSGNLDEILKQMATYYEKENFMRQKLKGAMIYPIILCAVGVGMLIFFTTFVLPEIMSIINDSGQELPILTKIVLGVIDFFKNYGLILAGVILLIVTLIKFFAPKKKINMMIDKLLIKTPLINVCIQNIVTARFLRSTYIMLKGGITLMTILESVEKTLGNTIAEECIRSAMEGVKRGGKLSVNLANVTFFDSLVIQMIEVGEETGQLENVLEKLTLFIDKETDSVLTKLIASVEPLFTVIIGAVIALLVVSMMLPMFGMISNFKAGA